MSNLSKLVFDSRENYMKRSSFSGSTTGTYGGSAVTIDHNHGFIPFFIVGVELFDDGVIWSNDYVYEFTQSSTFSSDSPPTFDADTTTTVLTITLFAGTGADAESGTQNIYYITYLDYQT